MGSFYFSCEQEASITQQLLIAHPAVFDIIAIATGFIV